MVVNVFLGTLPLLTIAWGLFQNNLRLSRVESKLDAMSTKLSNVSERLVRVETRLEGGKLLLSS